MAEHLGDQPESGPGDGRLAVSVVVPCFNEEQCLREMIARVSAAARIAVGQDYEVVLINDGSSDSTWDEMRAAAAADPKLTMVNLSRNYGHQIALTAGLTICRGARIFIIDADLQDPPELLSPMMATMNEGYDVVYGQRRSRSGETIVKTLTAKIFYRGLTRLTDVQIPQDTGDFRLMSRRALNALLAMPETNRFVRGMVTWVGFPQRAFLYDRAERYAGETKYPLSKMLRLAFDAVTGFSTKPLRLASLAGVMIGFVGFLALGYIAASWSLGLAVPGWASTMAMIAVVGSVQLIVLGVMGEYIGRLYVEAKRRPLFIVQDLIGGGPIDASRVNRLGSYFETERA